MRDTTRELPKRKCRRARAGERGGHTGKAAKQAAWVRMAGAGKEGGLGGDVTLKYLELRPSTSGLRSVWTLVIKAFLCF